MRRKVPVLLSTLLLAAQAYAADSPYVQTVKSLNPTYYYQLNETDTAHGVVDSMGNGPTGSYNGDYGNGPEVGVPGPDFLIEGGRWTTSLAWDEVGDSLPITGLGNNNVAHASNNEGHITLGDGNLFAANAMTVSLFALGGPAQGGDRVFTNNMTDPMKSFQIVVGNDGIVVSTNPDLECTEADGCGHKSLFLPDEGIPFTGTGVDRGLNDANNGWWHIVASTSGSTPAERTENIHLFLNGVDRTADMMSGTTGWGTNTGLAKIGGRRDDPKDTTTHSGAQDEVAIWLNRVLTNQESSLLYNVAVGKANPPATAGDYNHDGKVDVTDIDLQAVAMNAANPDLATYDENKDGAVNQNDRNIWIEQHKKTYSGDADLNGQFDSEDFVLAFIAGKYETGQAATWADGDWNGDLLFTSGDFVDAFVAGGYEAGPRAAVSAVPEPHSALLLLSSLLGLSVRRRQR